MALLSTVELRIVDMLGPTHMSFVERLSSIRGLPKINQKSINDIVVISYVTTDIGCTYYYHEKWGENHKGSD